MPTVASQPSLRSTQAIGAVLLHQFAKERFAAAGINGKLIEEAEHLENLDHLTASLLQDEEDSKDTDITDISQTSTLVNETSSEQNTTQQSTQNNQNDNSSIAGDHYHSIAESTTANDNTVYHSMNAGRGTPQKLRPNSDELQLASYGQQLRLIAEEFERTRMRQVVKDKACGVSMSRFRFADRAHVA